MVTSGISRCSSFQKQLSLLQPGTTDHRSSGGGSIDIDELETVMRSLGRKPSRPELLKLTGVDSNGEALELELHSFARIMMVREKRMLLSMTF